MDFVSTPIEGAYVVELNKLEDERGFFSRVFCTEEFKSAGLNDTVVQSNLSHNAYAGTLRGMHYQVAPAMETKLVRCVRGSIVDTIIDMRVDSPSYLATYSVELTADNGRALFVPALCAHGFQTLQDHTDVLYMVSGSYQPEYERGIRFNDPSLNLIWPLSVAHISDKDAQWPLLQNPERTID